MQNLDECEMHIAVTINGTKVSDEIEPRQTLADYLRYRLRLTGTHVGCEHGVCGSCTILMDGRAVRSCLTLAVQADQTKITTVEGLVGADESLSALQVAFRKHNALQCGFCTPGMLTTLHAFLSECPDANEEQIREAISGNICRCTGYVSIVEAALEARYSYRRQASE